MRKVEIWVFNSLNSPIIVAYSYGTQKALQEIETHTRITTTKENTYGPVSYSVWGGNLTN